MKQSASYRITSISYDKATQQPSQLFINGESILLASDAPGFGGFHVLSATYGSDGNTFTIQFDNTLEGEKPVVVIHDGTTVTTKRCSEVSGGAGQFTYEPEANSVTLQVYNGFLNDAGLIQDSPVAISLPIKVDK